MSTNWLVAGLSRPATGRPLPGWRRALTRAAGGLLACGCSSPHAAAERAAIRGAAASARGRQVLVARLSPRALALAAVAVASVLAAAPQAVVPQAGSVLGGQDDRRREVALRVTGSGFDPARIDARLNDIVTITLTAGDEPHGLSLDAYRIAKRVEPGTPLRFEFRAETTGTFRFYCSLTGADGRAHDEHGELVVRR